jgi:hypothetical protein
MMTRDVAKVKNSNNDDIFHFFLEYQHRTHKNARKSLENLKVGLKYQ